MNKLDQVYSDILHVWFSGYLDVIPPYSRSLVTPSSLIGKLTKILRSGIRSFVLIFFRQRRLPKNATWLFINSMNNYHALEFLLQMDNTVLVYPRLSLSRQQFHDHGTYLELSNRFFYLFTFPFQFLRLMFTNKKSLYLRYFDLLFDTVGLVPEYSRLIRKFEPRLIVFANDHTSPNRSLLHAASSCRIKTVYIQHASVSQYFPPLNFDLSLLEGQDSYDKYKAIGIRGEVKLIGMPKYDEYVNCLNSNQLLNRLGICYNMNDQIDEVQRLIDLIQAKCPGIDLLVRPHPSDKRKMPVCPGVSNPRKESAFEFLQHIDAVIVANSSILLEAALMNVYPIYFNVGSENSQDYYGFVKKGLADAPNDQNELIDLINELESGKSEVVNRAKYYNATIGTDYYGKSKELAIQEIAQLRDGL